MRKKNRELTKREREVMGLMLQGYTNGELSEQLGIMRKTAEYHIRSVYIKMDLQNRMQLFKLALDAGVLKFTNKRNVITQL